MIPQDTLLLPLGIAIMIAVAYGTRRCWRFGQTLVVLALVTYITAVIAVTLFPLPIDPRLIRAEQASAFLGNNVIPLYSIAGAISKGPSYFVPQVGGNLALLMPLGLLAPLIWTRIRGAKQMFTLIALTALGIELPQLLISTVLGFTYRQADIDDLLMNTIGGMFGYALFLLAQRILWTAGIPLEREWQERAKRLR